MEGQLKGSNLSPTTRTPTTVILYVNPHEVPSSALPTFDLSLTPYTCILLQEIARKPAVFSIFFFRVHQPFCLQSPTRLSYLACVHSWIPLHWVNLWIVSAIDVNNLVLMSVGWDVKWCPVSRITTPLARKRPFRWISMKSRLVRAARKKMITFHY